MREAPSLAMFIVFFVVVLAGMFAFAEPAQAQARVIPTLDCIDIETRLVDGPQGPVPNTFITAHLGHRSEFPTPVSIPVGSDNFFSPGAPIRGQPTTFPPGRNDRVFEVEFNQTRTPTLTWFLSAASVPSGAGGASLHITDDPDKYCTPQPPIVAEPESLDFGEALAGGAGGIEAVTIRNNRTADLRMDRTDVIGRNVSSFRKSGDDCSGEVLAFSESCELRMRFVPRSEGPASATLRIFSNAFDSPARISLSGTGTVAPAPSVASANPGEGVRGETFPITINGSGFTDGASASLVRGPVRLAVENVDVGAAGDSISGEISIPDGLPLGEYDIEVRNPDGQRDSLEGAFTVSALPAPSITGVSPNDSPRGRGATVSIEGENLRDGANVSLAGTVRLRASSVSLGPSGDLSATFSIPGNMPFGRYAIEVRNPDGQTASLPDAFTVAAPTATAATQNVGVASIQRGRAINRSGRLFTPGHSAAGRRVVLFQLAPGTRVFRPVRATTTNANGVYVFRGLRPGRTIFYQVRFAGSDGLRASNSPVRRVVVRR